MKSTSLRKDFIDQSSVGTMSSSCMWSTVSKRSISTTYIDGTMLQNHYDHPCSVKDSFPKGKNRPKSVNKVERKLNRDDTYLALLPAELKSPSFISSVTPTRQPSIYPDESQKTFKLSNKRLSSALHFDNRSESKWYTPCATSYSSNGWVRRHKSLNESLKLSDLLRDHTYREQILMKKCSYQQLLAYSSPSTSFKFK
ncbi:hypothetical protein I4U23_001940 [Adineta vaga]|nr:hypothetical protein I4U23_001940 [Adineta vaga]